MTYTATISSKGQITLPAAVRRSLQLHAGDKITIVKRADAIEIKPSSYDQELAELRYRAAAHMKQNGTWGASWEQARQGAGEARLKEYRRKYGQQQASRPGC